MSEALMENKETVSSDTQFYGQVQNIPVSAMAGSVHAGTNNQLTLQNAFTVQEIFNQANITNTDVRLNVEVHDNRAPIMFGSNNAIINQPTFLDEHKPDKDAHQTTIISSITKNLIDLTEASLQRHRKSCFVETRAVKAIKEKLQKFGTAVLYGKIGDGKTAIALEVMDRISAEEGKVPIQIQSGSTWQAAINIKSNYTVLIEDIFGKGCFRLDFVKAWLPYFHSIRTCVELGNIYVLITSRKDIMNEAMRYMNAMTDDVNALFSKSHIFDFTKEYQLSIDEKRTIFQKHILLQQDPAHPNIIADENFSLKANHMSSNAVDLILRQETVLGFPMMCSLFVSNRDWLQSGVCFFQKLCPRLLKEIQTLYYNDKLKYFTLVYMFLNNKFMNLDIKKLFALSKEEKEILYDIADRCGVTISRGLPAVMKDSADVLVGIFVKYNKVYHVYEFINNSIIDAVCLTYGENFPQEVLKKCMDSFICDLVCTYSSSNSDCLCLRVNQEHFTVLAERITQILLKDVRQFNALLPLKDTNFVDDLFLYIEQSGNLTSVLQIICTTGLSDHSLIYFSADNAFFLSQLFKHAIVEYHDTWWMNSEINLALERAIQKGNIESVKILCDNGAWLVDDSLAIAIRSANVSFVNDLISKHDFTVAAKHKSLCASCGIGDLDMIKYLLEEQGIEPSVRCLIAAIISNCFSVFKYVLKSRRWTTENKEEVMDVACRRGNILIIKVLEEDGAKFGPNSLLSAAESLNNDVLEYVLRHQEWTNEQKTAALDLNCSKGRIDMIKKLQEYGAFFSEKSLLKSVLSNNCDVVDLALRSKVWSDSLIQEMKDFARDKCKIEIVNYLETTVIKGEN